MTRTRPVPALGAVVLAGGRGRRLGGTEKARLQVDGVSLLERALAATATADPVVVVGPQVPTGRPVGWTREQPPGGGPAAGLLAGLDALDPRPVLVCVLAVDMPLVDAGTVGRLRAALERRGDADGAVLRDHTGRRQPLAAVYRTAALLAVRPDRDAENGLPMHRLVAALSLVEVPATGEEAHDVDTWEDLRRLE